MGDNRALIKIYFSICGVKDESEMSINYFPDDSGVDRRVIEFFQRHYEKAYAKYQDDLYGAEELERRRVEAAEREILAQLKAKCEPTDE